MRRALACGFVVALGFGVGAGRVTAVDCAGRFPEGRFGISTRHPAVAKLVVPEFAPLYLAKHAVSVSGPEDCTYVYTHDVFRMVETRSVGVLLAGCVGDFDGDGRADVALLMKRARDGTIAPFVFQARGADYRVIQIEAITDPYGFAEDKTVWPGPFCIRKPPGGIFTSPVEAQKINVVGDLFTIGWKTYFWNPAAGRFDAILTSD